MMEVLIVSSTASLFILPETPIILDSLLKCGVSEKSK